jgi:hypothetical protein
MHPQLAAIVERAKSARNPASAGERATPWGRFIHELYGAGLQHSFTEADLTEAAFELGYTDEDEREAALEQLASWL